MKKNSSETEQISTYNKFLYVEEFGIDIVIAEHAVTFFCTIVHFLHQIFIVWCEVLFIATV